MGDKQNEDDGLSPWDREQKKKKVDPEAYMKKAMDFLDKQMEGMDAAKRHMPMSMEATLMPYELIAPSEPDVFREMDTVAQASFNLLARRSDLTPETAVEMAVRTVDLIKSRYKDRVDAHQKHSEEMRKRAIEKQKEAMRRMQQGPHDISGSGTVGGDML